MFFMTFLLFSLFLVVVTVIPAKALLLVEGRVKLTLPRFPGLTGCGFTGGRRLVSACDLGVSLRALSLCLLLGAVFEPPFAGRLGWCLTSDEAVQEDRAYDGRHNRRHHFR
jgi:hypothetical protein